MFDLFRNRARAVRIFLGAILMLVAVSMVITLIPGFVGASFAPDTVIAEIGDDVLTTRDVQVFIAQQLRNKAFPAEMVAVYAPMIVNQMIAERALAYQAQLMGFQVTDAEVAATVQSLFPQLFPDGKFVGRDVYQQYLAQMNLTIPEFERNVRLQILLMRLMNIALEGEVVTQREVEDVYRRRNEKIRVQYISLGPSDFRSQVSVTPEEIRQYFEQNRTIFQIPEKRDALILVAREEEVARQVQLSDSELLRAYRAQQDRFRLPERVRVRHILLKTTGKSPDEIKSIRAKAEDLLKQIRSGADFGELARKYSEDAGTASNGGEVGWITRGQTVPNFEKTAFSLKPGEISGVIETEYGFHILQVEQKEPARVQPFEEVREQLAGELRKQRVYDLMEQRMEQARNELRQNPQAAEAIAAKYGLQLLRVNRVAPGDPIPEARGNSDLIEAIRTLPKRGVSDIVQVGPNELALAVVTEVYPGRPAELAEVEDRIRSTLVAQKAQKLAEQKARQLEARLKEVQGDLDRLAREFGLTVKTSPAFSRLDSVEGIGSGVYLEQAFEKPVGAVVGPFQASGQTVVCKVIEHIDADMSQFNEDQRRQITEELRRQRAQQRRELLQESILAELVQKGKVKIYQRNIERLISLYRQG